LLGYCFVSVVGEDLRPIGTGLFVRNGKLLKFK